MLGIKGIRGVGKTTLLLQYLKYHIKDNTAGLYVTADHPYFYSHTILELAEQFHQNGGKFLLIDEVHKYYNWSREFKNIYDGFPELRIIFTASSALGIYRGESDLSRRVITLELPGMSFREYLELAYQIKIDFIKFKDILKDHISISGLLIQDIKKPLAYFFKYLKSGYLPFVIEGDEDDYRKKVFQIIDNTITNDLAFIENYSITHTVKLKKLLGILSETAPFEPNISELSRKFSLGRDTVNIFLQHLQNAKMLNLLSRNVRGTAALKKPDKIYLENTNFSYALKQNPSIGTIRETFFLNQLKNSGINLTLPYEGDFLIDDKYLFEIGGKNKTNHQIKNQSNAFIASDNIEYGVYNKIPLWLFGFLY
jgi:predicted AAA+ superfamily ATPase